MFRLLLVILCFTTSCGAHRWMKPPSITASEDTLFIASFCSVRALDSKTGEEKWVYEYPYHKKKCDKHRAKVQASE